MKKHLGKIILVGIIVLIGGSILYAQGAAERANEGVVITEKVAGNPDAAVVFTEFADFQCPACAQAAPVVKDLIAQYGDQVRFEFKHLPLIQIHPHAMTAARAAEAAGVQGKFFEYHDLLFENQSTWSATAAPTRYFVRYAEELDLDVGLFRQHLGASLVQDVITSDLDEARSLGLTGTPSFLLNGERLQIASYGDLAAAIENALGTNPGPEDSVTAEPEMSDVRFGI